MQQRLAHNLGRRGARRGLTLVELVVGIVILGIVAAMVSSSVSSIGRARVVSVARADAHAQARVAVDAIAQSVAQLARDADLLQCRFILTSDGTSTNAADELMMLVRSSESVRGDYDEPEGGDREVQFRLGDVGGNATYGQAGESTLWQRVDPALDQFLDGGGIAIAVASGVSSMSIEAFDGERWQHTWDSDRDGLPYGVRVTVVTHDTRNKATAYAYRLIALDRVMMPLVEPEEDDESGDQGSGAGA